MEQVLWRTGTRGSLVSDAGNFRLVVTPSGAAVRYEVLKPAPAMCATALVSSGHGESVTQAMAEAERVASRLESLSGPSRSDL